MEVRLEIHPNQVIPEGLIDLGFHGNEHLPCRGTARGDVGVVVRVLSRGVRGPAVDEVLEALREWLRAPRKGFNTFEESSHSPIFEEPERVRRIMREDVLRGRAGSADGG